MASIDLIRDEHYVNTSLHNIINASTLAPLNVSPTQKEVAVSTEFDKLVSIIMPIVSGVTGVLGVFGNFLVVIVVLVDKQMRSTTNILILSLAVADLLFLLFVAPFLAIEYARIPVWPFGDVGCKIVRFAIHTSLYASVYTLVLMAIDRYLAVVHPLRSITLRTERNAWVAAAIVWTIALVANIPFLVYIVEIQSLDHGRVIWGCSTDVEDEDSVRFTTAFYLCFLVVAFAIPLGITITMYALMVRKLLHGVVPGEGSGSADSIRVKKRVSLLVITVTVIFAVCWMPIQFYFILSHFGVVQTNYEISLSVYLASNCLLILNSCINPFLYAFMSQTFNQSFRTHLCC